MALFQRILLLSLVAIAGVQATAQAGGLLRTRDMAQFLGQQSTAVSNSNDATAKKVLYFGGPVISNVKVIAVFWGNKVDPTYTKGMGSFYTAFTKSGQMDWLEEYNTFNKSSDGTVEGTHQHVGKGSFAGNITINPKNQAAKMDKVDVEAEIVNQIDQGVLPKPDADTLYMINFPAGITLTTGGEASCSAWCGDHEGFTSQNYGRIYYAMLPDISGACSFGCGFAGKAFDSMTVIASHEVVEAITDPMCPNLNESGKFPAAWLSADQNEVGDLCVNSSASLVDGSTTYALQGEWDNNANACKGGSYKNP